MRANRIVLLGMLLSSGLPCPAQAQKGIGPAAAPARAPRRPPVTFSGVLGLSVATYEADTANAPNVGSHAVGFDIQVALWLRRVIGIRTAAGVDFFRGSKGSNDHTAHGSFGVASIALALRTPPPANGITAGVDVGLGTVFEPDYSYSYTEGNTIYVYPSNDMPLRSGPYVEASVRRGGLLGWSVAYRQYFASVTASEGRLRNRIVIAFSASR